MKAALCNAYGPPDVIRIAEVPTPVAGPGEVLVRIIAASVSTADWRIRAMAIPPGLQTMARAMLGFRRPRNPILGTELSGVVAAVGAGVTRFAPGDEVVAYPGAKQGCHAEYRAIRADGPIIAKPAGLTHVEAAAMSFGGTTALHFLRDRGGIKSGERVLVIGASGSVGTAAVQIARHLGARVTGVCSAANRDLVLSLGAEHVIDYTATDFTTTGERYDIVLDGIGAETFARAKAALTPDGRFLMVAAGLPEMLRSILTLPRAQKAITSVAPERQRDLVDLAGFVEAGTYRPVIDSTYPLDEIIDAHRRVETHRKRGNVVVTMDAAKD